MCVEQIAQDSGPLVAVSPCSHKQDLSMTVVVSSHTQNQEYNEANIVDFILQKGIFDVPGRCKERENKEQ
jgi:hypothetical protein